MNPSKLLFRLVLGRRLPKTSSTLTVSGLDRPITIKRDGFGIPHVEAETGDDAWYGLGFCQGQDRAFQLDLLARVARGTLSELIGNRGLAIDRLSRRIGFARTAQPQFEALDAGAQARVDAFARGVTDGATLGSPQKAHEFAILRKKPTPLTALDVVAVYLLQAFVLASNWDVELARLRVLKEDGVEALKTLDPAYPDWLPGSVPPGERAGQAIDALLEDLNSFSDAVGHGPATNAWAIAPSRTSSGRPLLANDPHLRPSMPPHWYLAHVRAPEWAVAGAAFVGVPVFPAGHNGAAAWGISAGLADNSDLFIEELGPDGRSVREGDGFVPCDVVRETIRVKGSSAVVEDVVVTKRGPIVGPALSAADEAISLRATWLDPLPVQGFLGMEQVRTFEEFRRAFEHWPHISLNVVYADTSGSVGYQLVGDVPRRKRGYGTLPSRGADLDAGWHESPVSFDEMPSTLDPEAGYVATSNNQPATAYDVPFLGVDWLDCYRVARVAEAITARSDWDVAASLALQADTHSVPWTELRDSVLGVEPDDTDAQRAVDLLRDWDGSVSADSSAATVFEFFLAEMFRSIAESQAPNSWRFALGEGVGPVHPLTLLATRRVGHLVRWLRESPGSVSEAAIEEALSHAYSKIRTVYGVEPGAWDWGTVRPLTLRHPFGERTLFKPIFNLGPFPLGGDVNTVAQAAPNPFDPAANPLAIASMRMVLDVGNWDENRFSLPGGQSGNPLSPHYDDLLEFWLRGDGVPIAWTPEAVEKATAETLRVVPDTRAPSA